MMATRIQNILLTISLTCLLLAAVVPVQAQTSANFLYRLSDFTGPVASMWARLAVDAQQGEIYTLNRSDAMIQIYNSTAMQTFGFGEELRLGSAADITAGDDGEMYVLFRHPAGSVQRLNYRGESVAEINVYASKEVDSTFKPDFIDYQNGKLYLADSGSMQVVIASATGEIETVIDFRALVAEQIKEAGNAKGLNDAQMKKTREDLETLAGALFNGFGVDSQENIYFTIASFFAAYRYNAAAKLQSFGVPGSAPGKFGVVASIGADSHGNIFVSDRLRCVVLMFDAQLQYQSEFGYRGSQPHNLIVPDDIAIDERNQRIYVAQAANLGVSVFSIKRD